jgi:hypothetical protein
MAIFLQGTLLVYKYPYRANSRDNSGIERGLLHIGKNAAELLYMLQNIYSCTSDKEYFV